MWSCIIVINKLFKSENKNVLYQIEHEIIDLCFTICVHKIAEIGKIENYRGKKSVYTT